MVTAIFALAFYAAAAVFLGGLAFWLAGRRRAASGERRGEESHEPICAGLIAGAALTGIADVLVKVFLFD